MKSKYKNEEERKAAARLAAKKYRDKNVVKLKEKTKEYRTINNQKASESSLSDIIVPFISCLTTKINANTKNLVTSKVNAKYSIHRNVVIVCSLLFFLCKVF
jgi:hypothetical protein